MSSVLNLGGLNFQAGNPLRREITQLRNEISELKKAFAAKGDGVDSAGWHGAGGASWAAWADGTGGSRWGCWHCRSSGTYRPSGTPFLYCNALRYDAAYGGAG